MILALILSISAFGGKDIYTYQAQTGKCLSSSGHVGYNNPNLSQVFELDQKQEGLAISDRNLECASLRNLNFSKILKTGSSYVTLKNWNMKGANLTGTDIKWMVFSEGSVEGIDFRESQIGYTLFQNVMIDRFVQGLTAFCFETQLDSKINCQM